MTVPPDLDQARRYLALLDPKAEKFTFQVIGPRGAGAKLLHGTLDEHAQMLTERNRAGGGIFVTVNETDLKGRKRENITRVRAIWQEDDRGHGAPSQLPEPHWTVATSPGRYHRYWRVDNFLVDDHARAMGFMVSNCGSDPNAKDASRVLRLPGFYNHKHGQPFKVSIVGEADSPAALRPDDLPKAARAVPVSEPVTEAASAVAGAGCRRLASAVMFIPADDRDTWLTVGMALHHEFKGAAPGYQLWSTWSQSSEKFNEDDQEKVWNSFGSERQKPTTAASIYHMAQRAGWKGFEAGRAFEEIEPPRGIVAPAAPVAASLASKIEPLGLPLDEVSRIPQRPWIVPGFLMRGACTLLVAPGGSGKSTLALNLAAAVASGDGRYLGFDVRDAAKALILNREDDRDEMNRRLAALSMASGRQYQEYAGRLLTFPNAEAFRAVERVGGKLRVTRQLGELTEHCARERIGVVIFDPLVKMFADADENSNGDMDFVAGAFAGLARDAKCAVVLVHHTKKPPQGDSTGHAGSADTGRGASAIVNACRVAKTLFSMTEAEAKRLGVADAERLSYSRLDDAKANYAPRRPDPNWFKTRSVPLKNGDTAPAMLPEVPDRAGGALERRARIVRFVAERENGGEPVSAEARGRYSYSATIAKALGSPPDIVKADVQAMLSAGDLEREARGRRSILVASEDGRNWAGKG